jgi:uncharacterized protein (DUF697 family)
VGQHLTGLVLYSALVAVLLSLFMRDGVRPRIRFALALAGSMVGIAVAVGWIMYLLG